MSAAGWQPFVGGKNGNENFRQTRMNNFLATNVSFLRVIVNLQS